jgi:uncharacterized protein with GYD domain
MVASAARDGPADASATFLSGPAAKGNALPTYITLLNFTDQGIRNIKESPKRGRGVQEPRKKHGCTVKEILWIHGHYDIVTIVEAPDEAAASALSLSGARS